VLAAQHFTEPEVGNLSNSIMSENVGQLEVPMQNFILVEMLEPIDALTQYFNRFLLSQKSSFFDVGIKVSFVTIFKHKIVVVGGLFHVVQLDDVAALATLQHLNLRLEQLFELACMNKGVPLTF